MRLRLIERFLRLESASGIFLLLMAILAIVLANSPWASSYFVARKVTHVFLDEGLMAFFFLSIGLELKREFLKGELSRLSQVILPGIAAVGGVIFPALIYLWINRGGNQAMNGWAIPVATDVAFAVGVLSLFGKRVPLGLKLFLMTLAIVDDFFALMIVAFFHMATLSVIYFLGALFFFSMLFMLNVFRVRSLLVYIFFGILFWLCVWYSGVHATLAGALIAFTIPLTEIERFETRLHPWVAFFVMPLFALMNAGVSFAGLSLAYLMDGVVLGVVFGLFIGKPLGVLIFTCLATRFKNVMPAKTNWWQLYGVATLCGIGFTMSLFLGTLGFAGNEVLLQKMRLSVLIGSFLSGLLGFIILSFALKKEP